MDISGSLTSANPPKRCQFNDCKKKLKLTDYPCRCKGFFCSEHRLVEKHVCSYDYRAEGRELLKKMMGEPVVGAKIVQI